MSLSTPDGFFTRPDAATRYNRSQRALERDLDQALATRDHAVLSHWKLLTKDGNIRPAEQVTTDEVKKLVRDGETPVWYIEGAYLEERFGLKGSPRRRNPREAEQQTGDNSRESPAGQPSGEQGSDIATLPDDVQFLKERIRTLEREKRDEAARNAQREAKLFEQLDVKDRQISRWDEVSQGLTKALATGQLIPSLLSAPKEENKTPDSRAPVNVEPPQAAEDRTKSRRSSSKQGSNKKSPKKKAKPSRPKTVFEKHTPTFHKAVSGLFRRS